MTKEEELNQIFKETTDNFTGLPQGLSQEEYIELAKEKARLSQHLKTH